ncbi:UDP-phosphate galactose phosphotransferase [Mannheimia varigena]|uniref:exopolysaccharide biosynthesis polyprenyl glycosylphosphotransferase n=1 Tax=Mannheimia varigena TaxID=85404 RepID=UPI00159E0D9D|nr:exopolysaccharide biosynthesis polyprenyl glycosylphosphotransferase [Mannheimia varigena]QLB17950.1 UDP-phosphate galactose phosphotransferase [Mannheimia varigena]
MNKIISAIILIISDIFAIFLSIICAVSLRKILNVFWDIPVITYSYITFTAVYFTLILLLTYFGAYSRRFEFWHESKLVVRACFLSFIILFAALALGQNADFYSRSTLILIFCISAVIIPIFKIFVKRMLFKLKFWQKPAKIITDSDSFRFQLFNDPYLGYIKADNIKHETLFIDSANISKDKLNSIIEDNIKSSREIIFSPFLVGYDFSQSSIYNLLESRVNVFHLENKLLSKLNRFYKAVIDYTIVTLSSVFWLPLLCLIAIWIKLEDPKGDIFFRQRRLGLNGKEFLCYKFRSMYSDQSFMAGWLEMNPEEKAYYNIYHKYMNDPRITKVGSFLRKTSLDELPQLLNVLKGEMSIIGPRPYMVIEKKDIGNKISLVLGVKPGITGLWQVSGRSDTDFDTRVQMDVWYMKNWSLWGDVIILFKTFKTVLKRDGAY